MGHMTRKLRVDPTDGWHHVMNRGVDRQRIFFDDADRIEFGRCVALACRRFGVELHAYCLMDNHFHLLIRCPGGHVSEMMHLATGLYARYVNTRRGRVGHLFGDRFCSRLVTSVEYIANAVRYIHRNPLAIVGVDHPASYRWSSHQTYLGMRTAADFIRTDVVLDWFATVDGFKSFVGDATAEPTTRTLIASDISTDTVMNAADLVIAEHSPLRGRMVRTQRCAIALGVVSTMSRSSQMQLQVLDDLGFRSAASRRSARWRAQQHVLDHPATSRLIDPVLDLVGAPTSLAWAS